VQVEQLLGSEAAVHEQAKTVVLERNVSVNQEGGAPVGDSWEIIKGVEGDKEYALLRHTRFGIKIELPVASTGMLFSSGDGRVRRCWADGTFYERFAFRTGDMLAQAPGAQAVSLDSAARHDLGHWHIERHQSDTAQQPHGIFKVSQSDGGDVMYLLSDGFAFFGGGTRGVLVTGCNEPQVLAANQLRSLMGLGNVSPETALHLEQQRRKENVSRGARKDSRPSSTSRHDDIPKELCCGLTGVPYAVVFEISRWCSVGC